MPMFASAHISSLGYLCFNADKVRQYGLSRPAVTRIICGTSTISKWVTLSGQ